MQTIFLNTTEAISRAARIVRPSKISVSHAYASNMHDDLHIEAVTRFKTAKGDPRQYTDEVSIHLDVYIPLSQQITETSKTDDAITVGLRFFCAGIACTFREKFYRFPEESLRSIAAKTQTAWFSEHPKWGYGYCIGWEKLDWVDQSLFFQLDWKGRKELIAAPFANYQFCSPVPKGELKLIEKLEVK